MELSIRLETIASMVDKCECVVDVGTDHGYIPIYLVRNNICNTAIASDINKGPVEKARFNVRIEGLEDKINCRLGGGLTTINKGEVQGIVIAGMGGNLIRDIIEERKEIFKEVKFAVLQPVQNPEVLREYIYQKGYKIIDEELCIDENRFYEIIKIKYDNNPKKVDEIFYEVGKSLVDKKHSLLPKFIEEKIKKYNKILLNIKENTELADKRKKELRVKIDRLEELLQCL
ncbi:class I SAM-dependent methyltransferase [Clostridium sp. A1-XYC3]|uniref:Class I SAM-dependent methyltransferase n=1 Tax=Clostridium tanneri TaxID=3037988 RepID=A0ABU4JNV6_9CLOT|nr:class I SAM-dependent methyltransferase [Clostridium sp. A1-XYC3]MDW8799797.1 class I SAM-dependent methyltransferase [Clostridium sp. A1-XYC3]